MKTLPPGLAASLDAAGFPAELRRFVTDGTLDHYATDPDGTLRFAIPGLRETRKDTDLIWHPADPATWRHRGSRFFVEENFYHDADHHSVAGSELVPLGDERGDPVEALNDWLAR